MLDPMRKQIYYYVEYAYLLRIDIATGKVDDMWFKVGLVSHYADIFPAHTCTQSYAHKHIHTPPSADFFWSVLLSLPTSRARLDVTTLFSPTWWQGRGPTRRQRGGPLVDSCVRTWCHVIETFESDRSQVSPCLSVCVSVLGFSGSGVVYFSIFHCISLHVP